MTGRLWIMIGAMLLAGLLLILVYDDDSARGPDASSLAKAGSAGPNEDPTPPVREAVVEPADASPASASESIESDEVPSFTMSGRCVDPAGAPIQDVSIRWRRIETPRSGHRVAEEPFVPELQSDAQGRFQWREPLVDHEYQGVDLSFVAPGRVPRFLELYTQQGRDVNLGDLVLEPGASISGVVVDSRGLPLPGVAVSVGRVGMTPLWRHGPFNRRATTLSGPDGSFVLAGVPPGWWRVCGAREDSLYSRTEPVGVLAGEALEGVRLILEDIGPQHFIDGIALDAGGAPLPLATIQHSYEVNGHGFSGGLQTDAEGRFRTRACCSVAHDFSLSENGATVSAASVPPGTHDLVLQLPRGVPVSILVRDAQDGEPIAGAGVSFWVKNGDRGSGIPVREAADDQGRLQTLAPASPFSITVRASGYQRASGIGPFSPGALPPVVDVALERAPALRGRVLSDGVPVPGAIVTLSRDVGMMSTSGFLVRFLPERTRTETDGSGRFEIAPGEQVSRVVVRAEAPDHAPAEAGPFSTDELGRIPEIVLELSAGGGIEGSVRVAEGRLPAGIVVAASRGDGRLVAARTDEEGRYRLDHLLPGPWQVELREEDFNPVGGMAFGADDDARIPSNCVVLEGRMTRLDLSQRLDAQCVLAGSVRLGTESRAGLSVYLHRFENWEGWRVAPGDSETHEWLAGHQVDSGQVLKDGSYRVAANAPGTFILRIDDTSRRWDGMTLEQRVRLVPGTQSLDFQMGAGSIEGLWRGQPSNARIAFYRPFQDGSRAIADTRSQPDGSFQLPVVPEGRAYVRSPAGVTEVEVVAGQTTKVVLE